MQLMNQISIYNKFTGVYLIPLNARVNTHIYIGIKGTSLHRHTYTMYIYIYIYMHMYVYMYIYVYVYVYV